MRPAPPLHWPLHCPAASEPRPGNARCRRLRCRADRGARAPGPGRRPVRLPAPPPPIAPVPGTGMRRRPAAARSPMGRERAPTTDDRGRHSTRRPRSWPRARMRPPSPTGWCAIAASPTGAPRPRPRRSALPRRASAKPSQTAARAARARTSRRLAPRPPASSPGDTPPALAEADHRRPPPRPSRCRAGADRCANQPSARPRGTDDRP
jgi:hypothetical protein